MRAIYKKELGAFFKGIMGYVIVAFTLLIIGIYTLLTNIYAESGASPYFELALMNCTTIFLVIVPMITMRSTVEEKRQHTDALLYSAPVTSFQIMLGKYLAMLTVFCVPLAISCLIPPLLSAFGTVNFLSAYLGIFGFTLMGACLISVGFFFSSLTDNYVVAIVASFAAMLVMYMMSYLTSYITNSVAVTVVAFILVIVGLTAAIYSLTRSTYFSLCIGCGLLVVFLILFAVIGQSFAGVFAAVLGWIAVYDRFIYFAYGIFDLSAVVYFLTATAFFCFLTVQSIEKRRWA